MEGTIGSEKALSAQPQFPEPPYWKMIDWKESLGEKVDFLSATNEYKVSVMSLEKSMFIFLL